MRCEECGATREPADIFCRSCGQRFPPPLTTAGEQVTVEWIQGVLGTGGFETEVISDPDEAPQLRCTHPERYTLLLTVSTAERAILCRVYFKIAKLRVERRDIESTIAAMNSVSLYCTTWKSHGDAVGFSWYVPLFDTVTSNDLLRVLAAADDEITEASRSTGLSAFLA